MPTDNNFEKKLAEEQAAGLKDRLDDGMPIGALPDGTVGIYKPGGVPAYEPEIIGGDEPEDDEVEDGEDLGDA